MSSLPAAAAHPLSLFKPPYERLIACSPELVRQLHAVRDWRGCAIVWQLSADRDPMREFDIVRDKAPGLPLLILLPPPADIGRILDMLPIMKALAPRMILPFGLFDAPHRLRQVLATPPRSLPNAVSDHLIRRGLLLTRKGVREFHRIFELAPETSSIAVLSRRMYTSRRTLGRHFAASQMPVPSHCLHFARILNVAIVLQQDEAAVFRVARKFGYPDGFTLSNQMKRLTGYRPSQVRDYLGWEWLVEAWLEVEGVAPLAP